MGSRFVIIEFLANVFFIMSKTPTTVNISLDFTWVFDLIDFEKSSNNTESHHNLISILRMFQGAALNYHHITIDFDCHRLINTLLSLFSSTHLPVAIRQLCLSICNILIDQKPDCVQDLVNSISLSLNKFMPLLTFCENDVTLMSLDVLVLMKACLFCPSFCNRFLVLEGGKSVLELVKCDVCSVVSGALSVLIELVDKFENLRTVLTGWKCCSTGRNLFQILIDHWNDCFETNLDNQNKEILNVSDPLGPYKLRRDLNSVDKTALSAGFLTKIHLLFSSLEHDLANLCQILSVREISTAVIIQSWPLFQQYEAFKTTLKNIHLELPADIDLKLKYKIAGYQAAIASIKRYQSFLIETVSKEESFSEADFYSKMASASCTELPFSKNVSFSSVSPILHSNQPYAIPTSVKKPSHHESVKLTDFSLEKTRLFVDKLSNTSILATANPNDLEWITNG
ncbi:hypothetical protein GEMRC1_000698 [Eukaryota sp. GEM-RC1]